ncbi:hypothetical protein [Bathymodiolus thermophilus thioautotrophic gill symbiont]|uniref:hypothetical protein n=1 Tax=Bathymodiolus thermophilus thioautotrophic gill symbiont TaxID=2360 RepID=UPI001ED965AF|nr:hypothetical protein [Bathymodiolus thermophilus thioautotrophic gill symbiont]
MEEMVLNIEYFFSTIAMQVIKATRRIIRVGKQAVVWFGLSPDVAKIAVLL